jgi:hypothetical protein
MHRVTSWLSENFVPAWKAVSILLTGGFGVLGLVKNFKEKQLDPETDTKVEKITRWGWVSLIGILMSTSLGILAQLKESHDDSAKALDIATKSDQTLQQIQKLLSPTIDMANPVITTWFTVSCVTYSKKCVYLKSHESGDNEWFINVSLFLGQCSRHFYVGPSDRG